MDGQADLPVFPPGLDGSPLLDSGMDLSFSGMSSDEGKVTSTPFKPRSKRANVKGKERDESIKEDDEYEEYRPKGEETEVEGILTALVSPSRVIDESVFHARERAPVFSPPLHERSQSFSFGQTMFFSMGKNSPSNPLPPPHPSSSSVLPSDTGSSNPSHLQSLSPPTIPPGSIGRHRSRALSDTVFQSMLRSASPAFSKSSTTPSAPEAEINDECSADVQIYANPRSPPSEPDPFNANANTYYTPQTMIPTTPPSGVITHTRKTSKEENLIYSLQTQLTLQTELCSQFEADLRAKDEMVELLSKKLADVEKQENRRRGALKGWKKKVQELERAVRMLEEEVDSSRRESMERSVMDEASGEALRMLHRQIASLEQEKKEWLVREAELKGEVENLEKLMKEREEEIINLKEMLRKGEELDSRSKEAMLGNGSLVGVNEEELKRLAEREQNVNQERQAYRAAEMGWEQERAELIMKLESVEVEKTNIEEQLDSLKGQLKAKEEEFGVMKNELEAQWSHTETASEKIAQLQQAKKSAEEEVIDVKREKEEVVKERDVLVQRCEEVEERANAIEQDWNESESKNHELECEVHELWDEKEALEKEREQVYFFFFYDDLSLPLAGAHGRIFPVRTATGTRT
jgi:predicted  nucleic acid-binding Zn-ribbon protein